MAVDHTRRRLALLIGALILVASAATSGGAAEPTLARLSFSLSPAKHQAFATTFDQQLAPLLEERGWRPSEHPGRATPDSVYSRLRAG